MNASQWTAPRKQTRREGHWEQETLVSEEFPKPTAYWYHLRKTQWWQLRQYLSLSQEKTLVSFLITMNSDILEYLEKILLLNIIRNLSILKIYSTFYKYWFAVLFISGTQRCRGCLLGLLNQSALGDLFVRGLRDPIPCDADNQHTPLLGHDMLLRQKLGGWRLNRQGAIRYWRVRPVHEVVAWIPIRLKVIYIGPGFVLPPCSRPTLRWISKKKVANEEWAYFCRVNVRNWRRVIF